MVLKYFFTLVLFPSTPSTETKKERSDGVGPGRLLGILPSFHAHETERLLPVCDDEPHIDAS